MSLELKPKNDEQPKITPAPHPTRNDTIAYLITAIIFFGLGLLVGYVVNLGGDSEDNLSIAQAVEGTMIALTPTPTPEPTVAPIEITYSNQDYRRGDPNAPVKVVEFSDYQCPFCTRFYQETLNPLLEMYEGYVEFVYRDYPIFGEPSLQAAHAAACANEQDKFWEYHDLIFASQAEQLQIDDVLLTGFAETLELNLEDFNACLNDQTGLDVLVANIVDAQTLMGRVGTPTFLINGRRIVGAQPIEDFIVIINAELEALGITPPSIGS